jgi:FkbM family methyltransferase
MNKTIHTRFNGRNFFIREHRRDQDVAVFDEVIGIDSYKMETVRKIYTPTIVVDVGAHIGTFSVLAKKYWPHARIFSVEPEKENVNLLHCNVANYKEITPIAGAISYTKDKVLLIGSNATGGNFLAPKDAAPPANYKAGNIPRFLKLEDITSNIDCLKMDCEGGEYEILEYGNPGLLQQIKVTLGEYHGSLTRFKAAIEKAMPHMNIFYTGPGNTNPTNESTIGNFWGFSKTIELGEQRHIFNSFIF